MHDFYVKKEMTITTLLKNLEFDSRTSVMVNSEKVNLDSYNKYVLTPLDKIGVISYTQASAKGSLNEKLDNPDIKIENEKITKVTRLFLGSYMVWIMYFYSQLFNPEIEQDKPNIELDKIRFTPELIQEIQSFLESTKYEGLDVIKNGVVNWEVLSILQEKFNTGKNFNELEAIITGLAILQKERAYIEGKVNSASDFNENSLEKLCIQIYAVSSLCIKHDFRYYKCY